MRMVTTALLLSLLLCAYAQDISVQIYSGTDGSLESGFENYSWATVNFKDTTVVRSGSKYALSMVPANYAALYLHGDFLMPAGNLGTMTFWVNGRTTGNQNIKVNALLASTGKVAGSDVLLSDILGKAVPANTWVQATLQFSKFSIGADIVIGGIWFQSNSQTAEATIYFDDLQFTASIPKPSPVTVTVSTDNRKAVSPYIYGVNFANADQMKSMKYTVNRWGGNAVTRYSWDLDTANHASDWYFENIVNPVKNVSILPDGSSSDEFIKNTTTNGGKVFLTTPFIGWRPKDRVRRCGFDLSKYPSQQDVDPYYGHCGNGVLPNGKDITGNDPHDTSIETDPSYNVAWIKHIDKVFGKGTVRWFLMDNEPALWSSTHRDVHPSALTYDELWNRTVAYGSAIKTAFPDSQLFGPVPWGWCAYMFSGADNCADGPDRKAHGDMPILEWYIQQLAHYKLQTGKSLVDVIDVHFYPQESNVFSDKEDTLTSLLRLRSTRSLWDPTYTDESWISTPIYILRRLQAWISNYDPELKISVSEYNFGGDNIITGALAQVQALGIFGREGVYVASRWGAPASGSLVEDAFNMYRNYDGKGAMVSGDSILANTSDLALVNSFAFHDTATNVVSVVAVNKATGEVPLTIDIGKISTQGSATFYTFASGSRLKEAGTGTVTNGKLMRMLAARSATLAIIKT